MVVVVASLAEQRVKNLSVVLCFLRTSSRQYPCSYLLYVACWVCSDRKPRGVISLPGCVAEAVPDAEDTPYSESPSRRESRKVRVPPGFFGLRYSNGEAGAAGEIIIVLVIGDCSLPGDRS